LHRVIVVRTPMLEHKRLEIDAGLLVRVLCMV